VIRRIVGQANIDLPLLGKSDHAFKKLGAAAAVLGPLSWLITNVSTFGNRGWAFCHHRCNTSTMKSLVMVEVVK